MKILKQVLGIGWVAVARLYTAGLTFLTSVVIASEFGQESFGEFSYALALAWLFTPLFNFGLEQLAVKEFINRGKLSSALLAAGILLQLAASILISVVAPLLAWVLTGSPELALITLIISISFIPRAFVLVERWLAAQGNFGTAGQAALLGSIAGSLFLFAAIWLQAGVNAVCFGYFACFLFQAIFLIVYAHQKLVTRVSPNQVTRLMRYFAQKGFPLLLASAAVSLYMRLDMLMLLPLQGALASATYSAAAKLSQLISMAPVILSEFLYPRLLRRKLNEDWTAACFALLVATSGLALITGLLAPFFIGKLFGPQYSESVLVLRIQLFGVPLIGIGSVASRRLIATNRGSSLMKTAMLALLFNAVGNVILIPLYGPVGAAISTIFSQFTACVGVYLLLPQFHDLRGMILEPFIAPRKSFVSMKKAWLGT